MHRQAPKLSRVRAWVTIAGLLCLALPGHTAAQASCGPLDERLCEGRDMSLQPPGANPKNLKYGRVHWQEIAFYRARSATNPPLVAVLGTGGKSDETGWLRYRLNEAGYSVAFMRYDERVPTADAAIAAYVAALGYLLSNATELGFDKDRLALVGSRDAALFGTDPTILEAAGIPFESLRALVIWGSTEFDLVARVAEVPDMVGSYRRYYGGDRASYVRHSPITHAARPNAPAFLFTIAEDATQGTEETKVMVDALTNAGTDARLIELPAYRPNARRTRFMLEPDGAGSEILPFLRAQFVREPVD
jgi:arylformamidase